MEAQQTSVQGAEFLWQDGAGCTKNSTLHAVANCLYSTAGQLVVELLEKIAGVTRFISVPSYFSEDSFQTTQVLLFFVALVVVPWSLFVASIVSESRRRRGLMSSSTSKSETEVKTDRAIDSTTSSRTEPVAGTKADIVPSSTPTSMSSNDSDKKMEDSAAAASDEPAQVGSTGVAAVPQSIEEDEEEEEEDDLYTEEYAAPLHLHTLKSPARLRPASKSNSSRSSSRSRSRSTSPQPSPIEPSGGTDGVRGGSANRPPLSASSSNSSLTDGSGRCHIITEDMLTDRLGLVEIVPPQQTTTVSPPTATALTPVTERMCEDSLEDVHAFRDLTMAKKMSAGKLMDGDASVTNSVLETLDEEEGPAEEDDDSNPNIPEVSEDGTATPPSSAIATPLRSTKKEEISSPSGRTKDEEAMIMFEMLDVVSTPTERQNLEEERKRRGLLPS